MMRATAMSTALSVLALGSAQAGGGRPGPLPPPAADWEPPEVVLVAGGRDIPGTLSGAIWGTSRSLSIAHGIGTLTSISPARVEERTISFAARGESFQTVVVTFYAATGVPDTVGLRSRPGRPTREPQLWWTARGGRLEFEEMGQVEAEAGEPVPLAETSPDHQPLRDLPPGRYVVRAIVEWRSPLALRRATFHYYIELT